MFKILDDMPKYQPVFPFFVGTNTETSPSTLLSELQQLVEILVVKLLKSFSSFLKQRQADVFAGYSSFFAS